MGHSLFVSIVLLTYNYYAHAVNFLLFNVDMTPMKSWEESQPGADLESETVEYTDAPTPNIDAFRTEAIVFPRAYCGGSVCSPSRYSLLTGRYPVRSEYAIEKTLSDGDEEYGTYISHSTARIHGNDNIYNLPATLQANGYYTALVGKWHLMAGDYGGDDCDELNSIQDETLYEACSSQVKDDTGFDFVDAFYIANVYSYSPYQHNPEWIVSQAQVAIQASIDASQPFFLYIAPTLCHPPFIISSNDNAFLDHDYTETPGGTLTGDDVPSDTLMTDRTDMYSYIVDNGYDDDDWAARAIWMDDMFGAVINYLIDIDLYDDTFIMFSNDHGIIAKTTLYEQGIRSMQFIRYPSLFAVSDGPYILSDDLIVAQYDIPAVIYEIADIDIDDDYVMDGESWLTDVTNALDGTDDDQSCCTERYSDIFDEHSIVHRNYKYIFKAKYTKARHGRGKLYTYFSDLEQLYDLSTDSSEQYNIIEGSMTHKQKKKLNRFRRKMDDYIIDIACPADDTDDCITPSNSDLKCMNEIEFEKEWNVNTEYDINVKLTQALHTVSCDNLREYAYKFDYKEREQLLVLNMIVCCAQYGGLTTKYGETHTINRVLSAIPENNNIFEENTLVVCFALILFVWFAFCVMCWMITVFRQKHVSAQIKSEYVSLLSSIHNQSKTYTT